MPTDAAILYTEREQKMGGLLLLVFLFFIILLFYRTKYNNGESGLTNRLIKTYKKSGAKILNNVYIPYGNNKTTEIDAVMVYRSGIYVKKKKIIVDGFSVIPKTDTGLRHSIQKDFMKLKSTNFIILLCKMQVISVV